MIILTLEDLIAIVVFALLITIWIVIIVSSKIIDIFDSVKKKFRKGNKNGK